MITIYFSLAINMGCVQSKSKPNDHNTNNSKSKDKQNGVSNSSKVGKKCQNFALFLEL